MTRSGFPFPSISIVDFEKIKRLEQEGGTLSRSNQGTLLIRTEGDVDADLLGIIGPGSVRRLLEQEMAKCQSSASAAAVDRKHISRSVLPPDKKAAFVRQVGVVAEVDEQIYWFGKPPIVPLLLKDTVGALFAIAWFCVLFYYKLVFIKSPIPVTFPTIFLLTLLTAPVWVALLYLMRRVFISRSTYYAYTDRRMVVKSRDKLKQVNYSDIGVIDVSVSVPEHWSGAGTLTMYSPNLDENEERIECSFVAVENPYEVCREIKRLMSLQRMRR